MQKALPFLWRISERKNQSQILFQWKLRALHLFDFLLLFKTINFISQCIFIFTKSKQRVKIKCLKIFTTSLAIHLLLMHTSKEHVTSGSFRLGSFLCNCNYHCKWKCFLPSLLPPPLFFPPWTITKGKKKASVNLNKDIDKNIVINRNKDM